MATPPPPPPPATLRQRRYRALLEQMSEEGLAQEAIAAKLGVSQGLVSAILRGVKLPGEPSIELARVRLGLRHAFFIDESLGASPPYVRYLGEQRVERDDVVLRIVDDFIAELDDEELAEFNRLGGREWAEGLSLSVDAVRKVGLEPDASAVRALWKARRRQLLAREERPPPKTPPGKRKLGRG